MTQTSTNSQGASAPFSLPASDLRTFIDFEDGRMVLGSQQDCTPIAEAVQALHKAGAHGSSEMRHAARIPNVIVEKYCNDHGITFQQFMHDREHLRRVLNDPDLSAFRIWKGKI